MFLTESAASVLFVIRIAPDVTGELSPAAYNPKDTPKVVVPTPTVLT